MAIPTKPIDAIHAVSLGTRSHCAASAAITNEMSPTSMASRAQPIPEPVSTRRCGRVNGRRSRRSESVDEVRVPASVIASCYGCRNRSWALRQHVAPAAARYDSMSRTRGATSVPNSSMDRSIRSCESVPVENFMSKREAPSV